MAFKFILGHHLKKVLNDAEEKQKTNIKEYAGGHLNESVLLRAPLVLGRKPWESAHSESIVLTKPSKPLHKPRIQKESGTPKETLYDFSLGTSGIIPPVPSNLPRTPNIRYRPCTVNEEETSAQDAGTQSPKSMYSELEDGILIEELPPQELMMPTPRPLTKLPPKDEEDLAENLFTSQSSFLSRDSNKMYRSFNYSVLPMQSQGITRKDQYRKLKAFDSSVLQKKEILEQNVLSGEKAARHHERKLQQDLDDLNLNGIGPNFHRLQVFSNVLDDLIEDSPTFNLILRNIKTEYDNYIAKLLDGQTSQQHLLRDQVDQMASRGTSRPGEMAGASDRLAALEREAKYLLDTQARLKEEVKKEQELLEKEPEPASKTPAAGSSFIKKEQPVDLCLELEHMKALILEKLDELNQMRTRLREEFVPMSVCTHLEQCIKETEVEVQKLLKQNEYFERSIGEMDTDLKQAIVEADTSEKDARRIWRKVNSTRGMPGPRQGTGTGSDEEDEEENKWNWYIS